MVERRNPFAAWAQPSPATAVSNLEKRADMAAKALEQAERDLAAARQRVPVDDDEEMKASYRRGALAGALDQRARIFAILTAPIAARQPRLAEKFVFGSDVSARDAIAAMEETDRANAANRAKSAADLIVLAGQMRRGEIAAPVTGAGPKNFVTATPEAISAAARKARSTD